MALLRFAAAIILVISCFSSNPQALSIERNPPRHVTWIENLSLVTASNNFDAYSDFELLFNLHGETQKIKLQLVPNHDILSNSASVQFLRQDGTMSPMEPIRRSRHFVFKGNSFVHETASNQWRDVGTARISIREHEDGRLFEGTFTIDNDRVHVQMDSTFRKTQNPDHAFQCNPGKPFLVAWRDSDAHTLEPRGDEGQGEASDELRCGTDNPSNAVRRYLSRSPGREFGGDLTDTIGSTTGCPSSRRIALLGIATDCSYTADFSSTDEVQAHVVAHINAASQVYEDTFNISLVIQNLTISDANCPSSSSSQLDWNRACGGSTDTRDRLSRFSLWRGELSDDNALWTLLSACRTSSTVGVSWLGEVCRQGSSSFQQSGTTQTSSSTNIVLRNSQEWQVIAHEIGHSFGASHDCTAGTCTDGTSSSQGCCPLSASTCNANGQYIMNPAAVSGVTNFSPCTIGAICSAIGRGWIDTSCLRDNDEVTVITGPSCPNGTTEENIPGCTVQTTSRPTSGGDDPLDNDFGRTNNSGRSWFDRNRTTVIVVASVAGSICLLVVVWCIWCCARRKKSANLLVKQQEVISPRPVRYA
ncbi:Metallo-peptidase family M12-domain-containing protein [Ilyonectria robusta]|uniref:Metallo-peptidase family M12-domain-containing protein n=1 Tax=Ilyonectria robusta TaxID=1079257 RepID=UPI001E8E1418|nr:Metallo-peptidase family M12-domain-containing protein [Ilyonectria robusta]KAH8721672.1 Metallo-peptidase family M12-domain-containing protein [Ilyonectria robusta]